MAQTSVLANKKKKKYFQTLIRETLDTLIPSKGTADWMLKKHSELPAAPYTLRRGSSDLYDPPVTQQRETSAAVSVFSILRNYPDLNQFYMNEAAKGPINVLLIARGDGTNTKIVDANNSYRETNEGVHFRDEAHKSSYVYKNSILHQDGQNMGRYRMLKQGDFGKGKGIALLVRKI